MECSTGSCWSAAEVMAARLPDHRFRRVMAEILEAKLAQSEVSFSGACGSGLRQAGGRLLRHPEVTPDDLLAGHSQATVTRCLGERLIVVAQDSTSYNYSRHPATRGLGPLNDSGEARGIHQHSALAMTENKLPLGLVSAQFWTRPLQDRSAGRRRQVPIEEKESFKWLGTARRVEALFAPYLASGGRVVLVGDRESDIFDLLAAPRHEQMELLVRAVQKRRVEVEGVAGDCSLLEATEHAPVLGEYAVAVPARGHVPARLARLQLRCVPVRVWPPRGGVGHREQKVPVWVVEAREQMPEGARGVPLAWTLIATWAVCDAAAARRVVHLYTCRWVIEQLHFTLKSGCQAERLQMDDAVTLCNTLTLYLIVAWRLLYITHLARTDPAAPSGQILDEVEQSVLEQCLGQPVSTVASVLVAVAKMAGYEPYKNGPPPGVKSLWLGLRKLEAMAIGWKLAMDAMRINKCESR